LSNYLHEIKEIRQFYSFYSSLEIALMKTRTPALNSTIFSVE
ncbi:unnamed protein product, partial [marine sediment metagenome]